MPNVPFDGTLPGWRAAARALLAANVAPGDAVWQSAADAQTTLALGGAGTAAPDTPGGASGTAFDTTLGTASGTPPGVRVPRRFLALASLVACHQDPARWGALYRVLWRLTLGGEPRLLAVSVDEDVLRLTRMAKAVRRAVHAMHAFVRFRAVSGAAGGAPGAGVARDDAAVEYVAWFEPEHHVVERAAAFFVRRFPNMRWAILTPRGCARWDGHALAFGPGVERAAAATGDDALEALWGTYYAHVFNPARVKRAAMCSAMPKKYWRNLPEARLIDGMVREAPARVRRMGAVAGGVRPEGPTPDAVPGGAGTAAREAAKAERADGDAGPDDAVAANWGPLCVEGAALRLGFAGWTGASAAELEGWYPDAIRTPEARLHYYAARFSLVEVEATFRTLPTRTVAAMWATRTPRAFVFDVRAHALLTGHAVEPWRLPRRVRDLLPPSLAAATRVMHDEVPARVRDAVWDDFLGALAPLDEARKLGAVLLRLPRGLAPGRASADVLAAARAALGGRLAAVEFRHRDWLAPRVRGRTLALLERLDFAHTLVGEPAGGVDPALLTAVTHATLAVVRLHGGQWATAGAGCSPGAAVAEAGNGVAALARRARQVHVLFDSRRAPPAPADAAAPAPVR